MGLKQIFYFLFYAVVFTSCESSSLQVDVSLAPTKVSVKRFDQALFETDVNDIEAALPALAQDFPAFISKDNIDPENVKGLIDYILNPLNQKLYIKSLHTFEQFEPIEKELKEGFQHFYHYFPEEDSITIYTYISGLNYEQPVIATDSFLLIGLDLFLGQNYEEYRNFQIPLYVSKRFDAKYLPTAAMRQYVLNKFVAALNGQTLLEYMISLGKVEYFVEAMYPSVSDSIRFAFTPTQMQWCVEREKAFWDHLAQKNLLFSKDYHTFKKYIEEQPFISSLERESPGKAGVWLGYRIVKAFMEKNPKVTLQSLMIEKSQDEIFKGSKYHP